MSSDPFRGRYLFHMHTTLTDGQLTAADYFAFAAGAGVDSMVFLEHIRSMPTYNVASFVTDVSQISKRTGMPAAVGFEAKLLPGGALDLSERDLERADVMGIAEHGFPDDADLLHSSFLQAVRTYPSRFPDITFVWVHPGLWFRKRGIDPASQPAFQKMVRAALGAGVLIERNLRYGLPPQEMLRDIDPRATVNGADAHTAVDLAAWEAWR